MRKKNRKRAAPRVIHIDWTDGLADMFRLPCGLGLTPPTTAKVVMTKSGSTWSAQFKNASGHPVAAHVRLRHGPLPLDRDPTLVSEQIDMRFVVNA